MGVLMPWSFVACAGLPRRWRPEGSASAGQGPWAGAGAGVPVRHEREEERTHARFITDTGFWSQFDHETNRSAWPIPDVAVVNDLACFGSFAQVLRLTTTDLTLVKSPSR